MKKNTILKLFLAPAYLFLIIGCDEISKNNVQPGDGDTVIPDQTLDDLDEEVVLSNSEEYLAEINELLAEINSYRSSNKVSEPFLKARLKAFEGLLAKMSGNNA